MSKTRKRVIVALGVLVVALCASSFFVASAVLGQTYARYSSERSPLLMRYDDIASDYQREDVEFAFDAYTIRGHVYGPDNEGRGLVVFRHGIFSQHQDYLAFVVDLVDRGWKVFAYDAIGCGESDGDSTLGFPQSPLDVHAAVQFAKESGMAGDLPIVLLGHSWGGYGVAAALDFDDGVEACVSLSGFDSPCSILYETADNMMGSFGVLEHPALWLNNKMAFGGDADRSAADAINKSGVPVLVVHGTGDTVIAYDGASILAQRSRITNPNVEYLTMSDEGRDGHNTYFYSRESQAYLAQCSEAYEELGKHYDGDIPADELRSFRATIDIRRANTADPELMDAIDAFFAKAVGK